MNHRIIVWKFPNGIQIALSEIENGLYRSFLSQLESSNVRFRLISIEANVEKIEVVYSKSKNIDIAQASLIGEIVPIEEVSPELKKVLLKNKIDLQTGNFNLEGPIAYLEEHRPQEWGFSKKIAEKIVNELDSEIDGQIQHAKWAKKKNIVYRKKWSALFNLKWHWAFLKRSEKYRNDCDKLWNQKKCEIFKTTWLYGLENIEDELFLTDIDMIKEFMYVWGFTGLQLNTAMIFTEYEKSFTGWLCALIYLWTEPEYFEDINIIKNDFFNNQQLPKKVYRKQFKKGLQQRLLISRFKKWIQGNDTWLKQNKTRIVATGRWVDKQKAQQKKQIKRVYKRKKLELIRLWTEKYNFIKKKLENISKTYLDSAFVSMYPPPLFKIDVIESTDRPRIGFLDWPKVSKKYVRCEFILPNIGEHILGKLYDEIIQLELPIFQIERSCLEDGRNIIVFNLALSRIALPNTENVVIPNTIESLYDCFSRALIPMPDSKIKIQIRIDPLKKQLRILDDGFYKLSEFDVDVRDNLYYRTRKQANKKIKLIDTLAEYRKNCLTGKK